MQVLPVQHPANPSIPHNLLNPAPRPSNSPVPPGLLQLPASWSPGICHHTTTTDPDIRTPPRCSLTSTGCLLWLASNSRHWCLHTKQSRDQPPLTSNSSSDPTHLPDLYAPLPLDVWRPPARHTCTSRSRLLSVLAPRWWNDLPVDVRTAETLTTFKGRLKIHLFRLHLSLPPSLPPS